jgi:hypothetical protein
MISVLRRLPLKNVSDNMILHNRPDLGAQLITPFKTLIENPVMMIV